MDAEKYMLPCPSKYFLGIECFGCGSQRALLMVLKGDFSGAFQMFPAIYTILIFIGLAAAAIIDVKRNYSTALISLGILNMLIILISFFYKHFLNN